MYTLRIEPSAPCVCDRTGSGHVHLFTTSRPLPCIGFRWKVKGTKKSEEKRSLAAPKIQADKQSRIVTFVRTGQNTLLSWKASTVPQSLYRTVRTSTNFRRYLLLLLPRTTGDQIGRSGWLIRTRTKASMRANTNQRTVRMVANVSTTQQITMLPLTVRGQSGGVQIHHLAVARYFNGNPSRTSPPCTGTLICRKHHNFVAPVQSVQPSPDSRAERTGTVHLGLANVI